MTALSVNVNKIALLRNSRGGESPSVIDFAQLAITTGVQGITVHPRPDLRHITPDDVRDLHQLCGNHPSIEFNIEGNPFAGPNQKYPGFMALIEQYTPEQATLVPDTEQQLTSDHGFDLSQGNEPLREYIEQLKSLGCRVSLFMDPDCHQIELAKAIGADRIELYTGPYAEAVINADSKTIDQYQEGIRYARHIGLEVNAGHDLDLHNLGLLLSLGKIDEVSIGHALTVDALYLGYETTLQHYLKICQNPLAQ